MMKIISLVSVLALVACSDHGNAAGDDDGTVDAPGSGIDAAIDAPPALPMVIVIPLENKDSVEIYGDMTNAPYINGLMTGTSPPTAWATKWMDELPGLVPSEPHYVWMDAGSNSLSDKTFLTDSDPSSSNSTATTDHLSTQLDTAGVSWKSYQQGITAGTCPIKSTGFYDAKHDPFVFFKDVSGATPSATTQRCIDHHGTFTDLANDVMNGQLPRYTFITPDLCHDMHGNSGCPSGTNDAMNVKAGDDWLKANLPGLIDYAHAHNGVILLVWDEGNSTQTVPFLAIGDHVKPGADATVYAAAHSSQLALVERILGVPKLAKVANANDMSAMFQPGWLP
jgi:hypothetical protein